MQERSRQHHVENPEYMGIHYMDATLGGGVLAAPAPDREVELATSRWPTCRATPRGSRGQDWTDAYERHNENLQLIGLNDPEKRWVLKNPSHLSRWTR